MERIFFPIAVVLAILLAAHAGRIAERVDLSYAMTSLVFPDESGVSDHARQQLHRWISIQRKRLGRDRKWTIGPKRKKIDRALARLDECEEKLKDKESSNNQMQNTGTNAPDSDL